MYREITKGVQIDVLPEFLIDESKRSGQFVYSYHVRVTNVGDAPVQLVSRHWVITDGHGKTQEVKGPGVIGQQPTIEPGRNYEYTSFCPLTTPTGNMRGSYTMVDSSGREFQAKIPLFFLRNLPSEQVLH